MPNNNNNNNNNIVGLLNRGLGFSVGSFNGGDFLYNAHLLIRTANWILALGIFMALDSVIYFCAIGFVTGVFCEVFRVTCVVLVGHFVTRHKLISDIGEKCKVWLEGVFAKIKNKS